MKHRIGPDGDTLQVYDSEFHYMREDAWRRKHNPELSTWRHRLNWEEVDRHCAALRAPGAELERQRVQWLERIRHPLATLVSVSYRGEALGLGGLTAAQE